MGKHVTGLAVRPRTIRPQLERLPPSSIRSPDLPYPATAVADYLAASRRWDRRPVRLSPRVTAALWLLLVGTLGIGAWLVTAARSPASCTGRLCRLASLGGHPTFALVLAGLSAGLLVAMALVTRGLTRAGSVELTIILIAVGAGLAACLGAVLVALIVTLAILLAGTAILLVLITIGSRS